LSQGNRPCDHGIFEHKHRHPRDGRLQSLTLAVSQAVITERLNATDARHREIGAGEDRIESRFAFLGAVDENVAVEQHGSIAARQGTIRPLLTLPRRPGRG